MTLKTLTTPAIILFVLVIGIVLFSQNADNANSETPTINSTPTVKNTISIQPSGTAKDTCFITVNGKTYDVQSLKSTHTGGDIFTCGTDMTREFTQEHRTRYNLITPYLVQ